MAGTSDVRLASCRMMTASLQRHVAGLTWIESGGLTRSAHALKVDEQVWLIDPFVDNAAAEAIAELGRPAGVLQLLDRHNRDCQEFAQRLGVPLMRLPERVAGSPFQFASVVSWSRWREVALWWPELDTLVVAEAVGTAPLFALGRSAGVHPLLRLKPPRGALAGYRPERLLVGHGPALESGAAAALEDALAHARSDLPRMLTQAPRLLRSG